MTTTAGAMPNTVELVHRLHRVARTVVALYDHAASFDPPNFDASGRATTALGLWEMVTGTEGDDAAALRYARRVANPTWPGIYMAEVGS